VVVTKPLPSVESLRNLFTYDPDTGVLTWACGPRQGKAAGRIGDTGYLSVKIGEGRYKVHRIIWKLYHGTDIPDLQQIDHINRDRTDNRIGNLRVVTPRENRLNSASTNLRPVLITYPDGRTHRAESLSDAGRILGIHLMTVRACADRPTPLKMKRLRGVNVEYVIDY